LDEEQREEEERKRKEKEQSFSPRWTRANFDLFEREAIPPTYFRPSQWNGFSKGLLYSFTGTWVKRSNIPELWIVGRESMESEGIVFQATLEEQERPTASIGWCCWKKPTERVLTLSCFAEKANKKQTKQRRRREAFSERNTKGLQTLVSKAKSKREMMDRATKKKRVLALGQSADEMIQQSFQSSNSINTKFSSRDLHSQARPVTR